MLLAKYVLVNNCLICRFAKMKIFERWKQILEY